ncbi:hypothetical protein B7Z17_01185 [Candidatus Saccharibacteria bacterium 32-49-10]|nr:MAG: hypothetical protein B7Z17_01185 [Candidatus Saccharibacteria bacterium 32-49-10]
MKDVPSEKVQAYLDLFDGDVPLSDEVLIHVEDLKKAYKIGKQHVNALNGVTLDVHKGEFLALTGASGSGKSTLLQLMGGLDKPSEGSVTIHGNKLASLNDKKLSEFRNKTVGFVFQFFYLQPFLRLRQNLEVAGMPARTKRPVRQERVAQLAEVVGLGDRLEHFPKELSGGQMQRAAIARALLNNPEILLADEPTGNLDSENGKAIIDLFEKIRDEFGTTIVVVTHDAAIAARADREISLKDGVLL